MDRPSSSSASVYLGLQDTTSGSGGRATATNASVSQPTDPGGTRPLYQCIKTSLRSVVRTDMVKAVTEKLQVATLRANWIVTHALQLLKLHLIHCHDQGTALPKINRQFVTSATKAPCKQPQHGGGRPSEETLRIKATLTEFYKAHYRDHIHGQELNDRNMCEDLHYLAIDVVTMYETNIKQHFVEYAGRFVNVWWGKKALVAAIKKQPRITTRDRRLAINELCARLRQIKTDLLHPRQEKTAESLYHVWIDVERRKVLPQRPLRKDNFYYDIQCSSQDYLPHMLYMMKVVEARGGTVYNAYPSRSSIIPKHFRLDTQSLIDLCLGNLVRRQAEIWGLFFRTDKRCFDMGDRDGHAHRFDHQIETDSVSCSILLKRRDKVGERVREPKAEKGSSDSYIDQIEDYTPLKNKGVVGIDPNVRDLLPCVDSGAKQHTKFRYTQDTRRKETKVKKYRNDLQQRKQKEEVDGKSVVEWEAELSDYNRRTTNFVEFDAYIHKKNEVNTRLAPFYND